jgi:hypothetical protein
VDCPAWTRNTVAMTEIGTGHRDDRPARGRPELSDDRGQPAAADVELRGGPPIDRAATAAACRAAS